MADNRRSSARHAVTLTGKLALTGAPLECNIVNLSLGGALITQTKRHPMGARCTIAFVVPTMPEPIEVGATVRWSDEASVGIQFDGLRARDVWALNEYFKQLVG